MIQRPIRFLHPRYNLYIVPRPNQYLFIGASEIEIRRLRVLFQCALH